MRQGATLLVTPHGTPLASGERAATAVKDAMYETFTGNVEENEAMQARPTAYRHTAQPHIPMPATHLWLRVPMSRLHCMHANGRATPTAYRHMAQRAQLHTPVG